MTCREAIERVFADEDLILSVDQVIERVYEQYPNKPWRSNTIRSQLLGLSVNLSADRHSPSVGRQAFLFSLGNSRYRRWHPEQDGSQVAAEQATQTAENHVQTEDSQQPMSKRLESSETEVILGYLEKISRQLSSEDSFAMNSSRRKRDFGLFVTSIAFVLSLSLAVFAAFAALAHEVLVFVFAALGFLFLSGVTLYASGTLGETALSDSEGLAEKMNRIGGSAFPFDKRWRMQWEASKSSRRLRISLVCGALVPIALALTAFFVVLSMVSVW